MISPIFVNFDDYSKTKDGSVSIFKLVDGSWGFQELLTHPEPQASDNFGNSVSLSGDFLAVGAYFDDY